MIVRERRPPRSIAGSIWSGRLLAPITKTTAAGGIEQ